MRRNVLYLHTSKFALCNFRDLPFKLLMFILKKRADWLHTAPFRTFLAIIYPATGKIYLQPLRERKALTMSSTCSFSYGVFPRSENKMHVLFPLRCTHGVDARPGVRQRSLVLFQILRRILKPTVHGLFAKHRVRKHSPAIGVQHFLSLFLSSIYTFLFDILCREKF